MKKRVETERLTQSISLLQPTRPIFCTTKNADGSDHIAPFAWVMPISCQPPRIAFALQNQRGRKCSHSLENILRDWEFTINMPVAGQEKTMVEASFISDDRYGDSGFTKAAGGAVAPVSVPECAASLECRTYSVIDSGNDHTLILADVVGAVYDPSLYEENLCPAAPAMQPLINLTEYRYQDRQEHIFLKADEPYRVIAYYKHPLREPGDDAGKDEK